MFSDQDHLGRDPAAPRGRTAGNELGPNAELELHPLLGRQGDTGTGELEAEILENELPAADGAVEEVHAGGSDEVADERGSGVVVQLLGAACLDDGRRA